MAENNTSVAEPEAVEAVGETPATDSAKTEASPKEAQQNSEHRGNSERDRDDNEGDEREYRRRDRNRDDRPEAGRLQGPTDLMPELAPSDQDAQREELPGTRAYEVAYIVLANNDEAQTATQERLKTMIEEGKGAVDNVRVTESRRLAFPIKKQSVTQSEGVYVVVNARFSQSLIPEMDRFFKLEDNVLRHIILREGR